MVSVSDSADILWRTRWWELEEYRDGSELMLTGPSSLDEDHRALMDRTAKLVNDHAIELPPFPATAMRAMRMLQQEDIDLKALAATLEKAPILAAEILRTANSARYGPRCVIDTLSGAISYLGTGRIRESIMRSVMSGVTGGMRARHWAREEWIFSITCASIGRSLAPLVKADPEQCYVAALLHDIGRVSLLSRFDGDGQLSGRPEDAEGIHVILEVLHRSVGDHIAESWEFPPGIRDACAHHITGRASYEDSLARFPSTRVVEAAGDLCIALGIGRRRVPFDVLRSPAFTQLELGEAELQTWVDRDLPKAIEFAHAEE